MLFIVATPIGNLEDITLRALRTLREVDIIAAEDTRVTRKLLSYYDIHTPLISYHRQSKHGREDEIIEMLREGKNVALVSDAGTPGISDPGYELIARCIDDGLAVESIPGATAAIDALVLSGLPTARFVFEGFPPRGKSELKAYLTGLASESRTVCLYESPVRLVKTLRAVAEVMNDRRVAVVREATKMFQEVFRGSVMDAVRHFEEKTVKGEITLIIEGRSGEPEIDEPDDEVIARRLFDLISDGRSMRDAIKICADELNIPRNRVYAVSLEIKDRPER